MTLRHLLNTGLLLLISALPLASNAQSNLKIVTYNIHGGHGNLSLNAQRFRDLLEGDEHAICLQEAGPSIMSQIQAIFPEFPYMYQIEQTTPQLPLVAGGALISKLPILTQERALVQRDPGGDLWGRNAGFFRLQTGATPSSNVFLACFHNTYNWDLNDFASEQEGMRKFRQMSLDKMGQSNLSVSPYVEPYVLAGDFNIFEDKVRTVLNDAPHHFGTGRDHLASNIAMTATRRITTYALNISDHDAAVATMNHSVNLSDVGAVLSQHCNYQGYNVGLPVGNYTLGQLQSMGIKNDDISSIQVKPGYKIELYQHHDFSGRSTTLTSDSACLGDWNDDVSSIVISHNTGGGFEYFTEAENYFAMSAVQTEPTSDPTGGNVNVGWIDAGDWMAYTNFNIPTPGEYTFEFRVASPNSGRHLSIDLNAGSVQVGSVEIPNTGGWQNWTTFSRSFYLNAGNYSLGIATADGGWNINWLRVTK